MCLRLEGKSRAKVYSEACEEVQGRETETAETKTIFSERVQARAVLMRQEPGMIKWYESI